VLEVRILTAVLKEKKQMLTHNDGDGPTIFGRILAIAVILVTLGLLLVM
jgi:hypothetical protein